LARAAIGVSILLSILQPLLAPPVHAQKFERLLLSHPNSYDYSGNVLYDEVENRWKAWWCGREHDHDAIFYAWSPDKITWSSPQLVFQSGLELGQLGLWDALHVCHPTVLQNPPGAWSGWTYVMYYTGSRSDLTNKIGVALSMDGTTWVRWYNPDTGSSLLLDCPTGVYGCGIPSIVILGTDYLGTFTVRIPGYEHIVRARSPDGIHWSDVVVWDPVTPGAPGLSLMYNPDNQYKWLCVFTYNNFEVLYGAVYWGAPWVALSSTEDAPHWPRSRWGTSSGVGFYRSMQGHRPPDGLVWSMFGSPGLALIQPRNINAQELQAVYWGDGW
jgi:hypothetical protein